MEQLEAKLLYTLLIDYVNCEKVRGPTRFKAQQDSILMCGPRPPFRRMLVSGLPSGFARALRWSFKAKWGAFQYEALAERAKPQPEATHVRFECADGYWEIVSIEELADPRVVFVLRVNDELLLDEYSAPLRTMFPAKYGYKSAKGVTAVTFTDEGGAGYWSTVGPYSTDDNIQSGGDFPQDLPGERKQIEGGEITAY